MLITHPIYVLNKNDKKITNATLEFYPINNLSTQYLSKEEQIWKRNLNMETKNINLGSRVVLPATPKQVWKTSTASSGLSEIPPFSKSYTYDHQVSQQVVATKIPLHRNEISIEDHKHNLAIQYEINKLFLVNPVNSVDHD